MTTPMTDRPDLEAALGRAGNDEAIRVAAAFLVDALELDEIVLEAACTKDQGFDGVAFVTNRRILVQTGSRDSASFEALNIDSITNVLVRQDGSTWAVVAEAFTAYKVWGGFAPRAAHRLLFAAQWALTAGREVRVRAERPQNSLEILDLWRDNRARFSEVPDDQKAQALKDLFKPEQTRWWLQ